MPAPKPVAPAKVIGEVKLSSFVDWEIAVSIPENKTVGFEENLLGPVIWILYWLLTKSGLSKFLAKNPNLISLWVVVVANGLVIV